MKNIRKHAKKIALFLSLGFLFVSCSQYENSTATEQAIELSKSLKVNGNKLSGEELFKTIVFSDGDLAQKLPSLQNISIVKNMKGNELAKFQLMESEAISFLKSIDADYFKKFQAKIYTKDPETISFSILQVVNDLIPFVNSKLAIQNLSIDKIAKSLKKDANGKISLSSANTQMKAMCIVGLIAVVWGVVIILAVAAAVTLILAVNKTDGNDGNLILDTISLQVANAI